MFHPYSRPERVADAAIHVLGVACGLAACIALALVALPRGDAALAIGIGLYAGGLISMLGFSALYNMTRAPRWKSMFRRLDHAAIFVMIAGTYTPFALIAIGGAWGIGLLAFVWLVAAAGVALKLVCPRRFERFSLAAYLLLGWCILPLLGPLFAAVSLPGIILLAAGGLLYSLGVVFHVWTRLPYHNAIWHALVLVAAGCHFAAVLREIVLSA
jgi:hemolysin III